MPRQLSCRGMCKIMTWLHQVKKLQQGNFLKIQITAFYGMGHRNPCPKFTTTALPLTYTWRTWGKNSPHFRINKKVVSEDPIELMITKWWQELSSHLTVFVTSLSVPGVAIARFSIIMQQELSPPLQWRHNEHDCVSNHQRLYCLLYFCLGTNQRKHQCSTSLAFVREFTGNRWIPRTKGPVTRKYFHLIASSWCSDIPSRLFDEIWVSSQHTSPCFRKAKYTQT